MVSESTGKAQKRCPTCQDLKDPEKDFNKGPKKDGLQSSCRSCQNKRDRKLYSSSPERQELVHKRHRAHMKHLRALSEQIRRERGCACCPEREVVCLKFHHLDQRDKIIEVSTGIKLGWSEAKFRAEVAKCVVVCGNCHDKIHAGIITLGSGATGSATVSEAVG